MCLCRYAWLSALGSVRYTSSSSRKTKSHYDALGVTPKATHSDIKAAYYKLSMIYHPDKNKGSSEAIEKFRVITEAYEVLGNFQLRKRYDRGLLHTAESHFTGVKEDVNKYYSREHHNKVPTPPGRSTVYNFDEWAEAHYGKTFARTASTREKFQAREKREQGNKYDYENELLIFSIGLFTATFYVMNILIAQSNATFDEVETELITTKEDEETSNQKK